MPPSHTIERRAPRERAGRHSVLGTVTERATWFHLAAPPCCTESTASSAAVNKAFQTEHFCCNRQPESQSTSEFFSEAFTVFPLS